jgi:EmrB/QacA subfamily drug resistance transporter
MEKMKKPLEYKYIVAIIYSVVLFLDRMDITIVNVAMPTFATAFGINVTQTEWIATGFLLALAVVIPASGWTGDKFGTKKIFILANIIFTSSSLLCALSWSLNSLVAFRILQGVGGGMILPVGMSMVYRAFNPKEYPKVANYTLMPILVAPAIAPTLGGFILQYTSWHWIFLVNVPIGFIAILASFYFLKEERIHPDHPFDLWGFLSSALFLSLLLYTLSRLGRFGFSDPWIPIFGFLSILFLIVFIHAEKKSEYPLIDLKFFKIPLFVQANIMQLALQFCYFGSLFLIAVYFQTGLGMTPQQSGLALFTQPIGTIMMLPISARIFQKFGPKYSVFFGLLGIAATTYWILVIKSPNDILLAAFILWIRGLVIGLVNGPLQASTMFYIEKQETGRASSIFNAIRQIGISLGVAVSSMLLAFEFRRLGDFSLHSFELAFVVTSLVAVFGALIATGIDNKKIVERLRS